MNLARRACRFQSAGEEEKVWKWHLSQQLGLNWVQLLEQASTGMSGWGKGGVLQGIRRTRVQERQAAHTGNSNSTLKTPEILSSILQASLDVGQISLQR